MATKTKTKTKKQKKLSKVLKNTFINELKGKKEEERLERVKENSKLKQNLEPLNADVREVKGLSLLDGVASIITRKNAEVRASIRKDAETVEGRRRLNVYIGRAKEEGGESPRFGDYLKEYLDLEKKENPKRFYPPRKVKFNIFGKEN